METTRNIEQLLETLPDFCDADKLAELLLQHVSTINEYVRAAGGYSNADTTPMLQKFLFEGPISNSDLHDARRFLSIQFSQEGVRFKKSSRDGIEYEINPREVVKAIASALTIIKEGMDETLPYISVNDRPTRRLMDINNLTLGCPLIFISGI